MKLIDNSSDAYKFWSVRLLAVWSSAMAAWPLLSYEQQTSILSTLGVSSGQMVSMTGVLMFLSVLTARLLKQS